MKFPPPLPASLRHRLPCGLLLAALLPCLPLTAGVIATDGDVPDGMNAGGTAADPADYIIGLDSAYDRTFTSSIRIGSTRARYNRLFLRNGSTLRVEGGLYVGFRSFNNSMSVTGAGSRLEVNSVFMIGIGSDNTLTVEAGGRVDSTGDGFIGNGNSNRNIVHVTGSGSRWSHDGSLIFGYDGGNDNRLLITDAALVTFSELPTFGGGTGNFIGLDGGFLALAGDQRDWLADLLDAGRFRHWSEEDDDWLVADFDDLSFDYFIDDAFALAFSGYEGLGGYTIITAGLAAVPEPATCAAMAGLASLALVALRRRRR